ncbi:hypothetical protein V494_06424 [Pseudogymnoascus sp. VKM F-4513 (FW-928)]|nr:hypothetical protein V494_06424 [Pseudogymnoascus sp. VKM F-4513 (FW-928)]
MPFPAFTGFPIGAATPPSLGDWINPGSTPRAADQGPAIINARNASATPTPRGNTENLFLSLYFNDNNDTEVAASIVTACVDRTVYAVRCTSPPSSHQCRPGAPATTVTIGSDYFAYANTYYSKTLGTDYTVYAAETCALDGTTAATCTATIGQEVKEIDYKTSVITVNTIPSPTATYFRFDVEITAGAENTKNPSAKCGDGTNLNAKTTAIWALAGTFGVASLLAML